MAETKKTPITIDDKEYLLEDMTDEQKLIVNHIDDLNRKDRRSYWRHLRI